MNTIENHLKEGETFFTDGRIDEAAKCFKSILQGDPQNVRALNNLGVIYIQKKDYKTGVEVLLRALENNPEDDDVNMNLQSLINNELVQNEIQDKLHHIFKKKKLNAIERNMALRLAKTVGYSTPYKVAHLCIDITPNVSKENPVYLQGFSGKPRIADTAITPLFMKMLLIEDRNYNKTLIVSADIFGFNDIVVNKVKEIVQPWGIPPEAVILNASHNHYAPGTIDSLPQSLGPYYEQYAHGIIQSIAQNMDKLYEDLESCLIYNGKVDGKIGVNRRLKKDGNVYFGVNPEGYYESHTPFLFIQLLNTSQNLLLVNHGCHPTGLSGTAIIFADFPVYLSEILKQEAFISEVMFLQGAAGSTKEAQQVEGTITFTNTPEQVALNGKILADQVLRQLKEELEYVEGAIFAKKIIAYLPYQQIPSSGEIKQLAEDKKTPNLLKEWANILLENNEILNASDLPVTISLVSLSENLCFITFNGEPVAELGRVVLKQFSNKDSIFLLGYTNGLKAYLPTREQITEGGYESDQARYVYNLPAPFDESVEERIKDCIKSLIESWQERGNPNGFGRYHKRKGDGKAFFSLSSGRCGTQTLANILNTASNTKVYHHPKPYLVNETQKAYQDKIDKSKTFWRARKGVINDAWNDSLIFGELDHNMTPFATTIFKEIPDSKFILLIRNPWNYVRSGMRRNYYFGHPWDTGRLCPDVNHQDYERWQNMDQFEKICWLWNETYQRISKYLEQIPVDNYIVVKFEDLIANTEKSREIFEFLNLKKFRKNVVDSILSKKTNEQTSGSFSKPEEWTFQQHQTLIKECGETIKKYGYESYQQKYVDNKVQAKKTIIKTRDEEKQSILFIEQKGLSTGGHLNHIVDNLQENYKVRYLKTQDLSEVINAVKCVDIVWLEWAYQLTALVTQKIKELESKPVVCRLHGFEVFTELPQQINWNVIDKLIFVANHKREIFNKRLPNVQVDQTIIRNGVVTNKFSIHENKANTKKLLLLGHINYRKGLTLLIQFYNELLKRDPEYHLYIRGDWQDFRYKMAVMTMVHELKLNDKITFVEGWIDDLNAWLADKSHILSFSLEESFHYTIGNGMAAGLKPVIHAWNESREIWPNEFIFNNVQTFLDIMLDKAYEPKLYRTLLFENKLTSSAQTANIKHLIDELVNRNSHSSDRIIQQNQNEIENTIHISQPLTSNKTTQQAKFQAKPKRTEFLSERQLKPEREIFQIRNNYSENKKLGLLLKHDETVRDYMDLVYTLQTSEETMTFNTLIFRLQTNFHKIITSYFNTLSIPQKETKNIMVLLRGLKSKGRDKASHTFDSNESFILHIFNFIKANLPVLDNEKTIRLKSVDEALSSNSMTDFVKDIYFTLGESFKELFEHKRISLFLIHGSMSTLDFTPFSDVDTQLFLTDEVFFSRESLKNTAAIISKQTAYLKVFDPLQHHGFFISTDLDRAAYPQAYLPFATMENGVAIFGNQEQKFIERSSDFENKSAVWNLCHFFRASFLNETVPETPFDMKRYISRFAMLPVLYLELFENQYPYKRDSFEIAPQYIEQNLWSVYETVRMARKNWNPSRLTKFNPSFYKGVF